ncbi:DUF1566 domain-containing protein [Candidatus Bipolaricaulota bacterium]
MNVRKVLVVFGAVVVFAAGLFAGRQLAKMGSTDSTSAPSATASYTLEDIYNRLLTGAPGAPATFTEPKQAPIAGTMNTLDEIMALAGTQCTQCNPPAELSNEGRWCDSKDGTVTDMTTGLVWLKNLAGWGGWQYWTDHDWDDDYDYEVDAFGRVSILEDGSPGAGLSDGSIAGDWRLPTLNELTWVTTGDEKVLCESPGFFTDLPCGAGTLDMVWTSTPTAESSSSVEAIQMDGGAGGSGQKQVNKMWVWPVRSP